MKIINKTSLIVITAGLMACAKAELPVASKSVRNDLDTCRVPTFQLQPAEATRLVVVAIDQTTALPPELADDTVKRTQRSLQGGDRVMVITFSGLNQDHFSFTQFDGILDNALTEEETNEQIPGALVGRAKGCIDRQHAEAKAKVGLLMADLLAKPINHSTAQSEILKALVDIGEQTIDMAKTADKLLLLISDTMENNAVMSFYGKKRGQPTLNPGQALALAKQNRLVAKLADVRVYVAGAALSQGKANPDLKLRLKLKAFWENYLTEAHAKLAGWGEPALLGDLL